MPTTIEKAIELGVPMLTMQISTEKVPAFIEFELIELASMMNVDQRLNLQAHQLPVIAQQLYEAFKSESIEDISICFKRGAMGNYGEIFRLDGAVITGWMKRYLEEKYQVVESTLMQEKESIYQVKRKEGKPAEINPERNLLAALQVAVTGEVDPVLEKHLQPWQIEEIKKNAAIPIKNTNNADANAYQRYKLFQRDLKSISAEFYKNSPDQELSRFDDDEGHYVYAATIEDAEKIYNQAKSRRS